MRDRSIIIFHQLLAGTVKSMKRLSLCLTVATVAVSAFLSAQAQSTDGLPSGTQLCSAENQRCNFDGQRTVLFGAQGQYLSASRVGGTDCTVAAFGADPKPNVPKFCFLLPQTEQPAQPQQPAQQQPTAQPNQQQPAQPQGQQPVQTLNRERLQSATYVILPPVVQGNTNLVSGDQLKEVLAAMSRDSAGALKRRYPNAQFTEDMNAPNVIRVTPLMVAPSALVPWATLRSQLTLQDSVTGQQLVSKGSYGLLTVYNHRADAANFVFDQLTQQLP